MAKKAFGSGLPEFRRATLGRTDYKNTPYATLDPFGFRPSDLSPGQGHDLDQGWS